MPYIREAWYVAAFAEEVSRTPISRILLDEPVVLYRDEAGSPVALSDVCPHRRAPLHLGTVVGDEIACPYHGLRFDPSGKCTHNPNFHNPAPSISTTTYSVIERDRMMWIWMGEGAGDPATILPFSETVESDTIRSVNGYLNIRASERLITANLLDLSHAEFLHPYLAYEGFNTRLKQEFRTEGDRVWALYGMEGEPLTPLLTDLWEGDPVDKVDMRFEMRWDPPANLLLEICAKVPGTSDESGLTVWTSHLLTPETEHSTHYFWMLGRSSKLDDRDLDERIRAGTNHAFMNEDAPIIEWQQRYSNMATSAPYHPRLLPGDTGGARAQRIFDRIRSEELEDAAG